MTLYEARNASLHIDGKPLVHDISFAIKPGECLALVGESGSGKSLTSLSPFGLTPARLSGSVQFDGEELREATSGRLRQLRRNEVGFVFQQPLSALTAHMQVADHLSEACRQTAAHAPATSQMADMLCEVGLEPPKRFLGKYPHQLSGGERQRVMIACAIAHRPRLLIADEPVSALDAPLRKDIMELLSELRRRHQIAMLMVTHDLAHIGKHADRLIILRDGALVETGRAAQVAKAPASAYGRALWDAVPRIAARIPKLRTSAPPPPPSPPGPLLSVRELTVEFAEPGWRRPPFRAVDQVSLDLHAGEAVAMVGGSGSGKSTIGRAIAGIGPVSAGTISWKNEALSLLRSTPNRRQIQPIFQDPLASLNPRWRVSRIIAEPLVHLRPDLSPWARAGLVKKAMQQVELSAQLADRLPTSLSGGQAQRVALARALVVEPEMLVLDEATSALDPLVAHNMMALLDRLRSETGLAMLFITHDLALAAQSCSRIILLDKGRIIEDRAAAALVDDPQTEIARRMVNASL